MNELVLFSATQATQTEYRLQYIYECFEIFKQKYYIRVGKFETFLWIRSTHIQSFLWSGDASGISGDQELPTQNIHTWNLFLLVSGDSFTTDCRDSLTDPGYSVHYSSNLRSEMTNTMINLLLISSPLSPLRSLGI